MYAKTPTFSTSTASCHDDDRNGLIDHANLLEKLEPVELFHLGIGNRRARRFPGRH
jgi:hypothetical protein